MSEAQPGMIEIITDIFKEALQDYFLLLNRGYPVKTAVKFVGDRYRLGSVQRIILFRGVAQKNKALARKSRITKDLQSKTIYIDGYNVLFTLMNYLYGKFIFLGNDGLLRDCGEVFGKIDDETFFYRAVDIFFEYLAQSGVAGIEIYLDAPVSGSALHVDGVGKRLAATRIAGKVLCAKSVDERLREIRDGIIATSDSGIIDGADCLIADIAKGLLEQRFGVQVFDLGTLLPGP